MKNGISQSVAHILNLLACVTETLAVRFVKSKII